MSLFSAIYNLQILLLNFYKLWLLYQSDLFIRIIIIHSTMSVIIFKLIFFIFSQFWIPFKIHNYFYVGWSFSDWFSLFYSILIKFSTCMSHRIFSAFHTNFTICFVLIYVPAKGIKTYFIYIKHIYTDIYPISVNLPQVLALMVYFTAVLCFIPLLNSPGFL